MNCDIGLVGMQSNAFLEKVNHGMVLSEKLGLGFPAWKTGNHFLLFEIFCDVLRMNLLFILPSKRLQDKANNAPFTSA